MSENKFTRALNSIDKGRLGEHKGIPIHFPRLRKFLPNIQQGTYYLLGASTGCGKTSVTDDIFFFNALEYRLSNPDNFELDIDYFSFEINSEIKLIKGICRQIWYDFNLLPDVSTVLSRGENYCSDEIYEIVKGYADYYAKTEDYYSIFDEKINPTGIWRYLTDKAEKKGTVLKKNVNKNLNEPPIMVFDKYIPNNPNLYWIVIIDHVSLLGEERGFTTKQIIDKLSNMMIECRNKYNIIPVIIQQLTFDTDNDERFKSNRLTPTLRDFGDSKYTTRDANVAMALFSPYAHGLTQFEGYDITQLGNKFRNLEIIKNRDGDPNINIGLNFIDKVGTFRELPPAKDMNKDYYKAAFEMTNGKSKYIKEAGVWKMRS